MLKKFIGKTIDAAKKSAKQMYGDDFVVIDSSTNEETNEAGITVMANSPKHQTEKKEAGNGTAFRQSGNNGVMFERSGNKPDRPGNGTSPNLEALRRFAKNQFTDEFESAATEKKSSTGNGTAFRPQGEESSNGIARGSLYSRASIRYGSDSSSASKSSEEPGEEFKKPKSTTNGTVFRPKGDQDDLIDRSINGHGIKSLESEDLSKPAAKKEELPKTEPEAVSEESDEGASLLSRFDQSRPKIRDSVRPSTSSRREQREITALHKRFDKLEALLDSAFISTNLDYASHPAFQQLVQTGISTSVIAGWFSEIIGEGIDPFDQSDLFMSKLSGIIRKALSRPASGEPQKYMLFTGPSGSGKTSLIMKLLKHSEFLSGCRVAVVSLKPKGEKGDFYYTIMEPFCHDHGIDHFTVSSGVEITQLYDQWEEYDHILIDTPAISTEKENSFREYWKIRQLLAPLTPLEVHYVVNASMNKFYFQNSSAANHPLQPDYVAVTHLDEVSQWGPIIPFLKDMGCAAKYISAGQSISGSLDEFDPAWFARKVLQDS